MEMSKLEKVIIWLKYDYLPRVGAYRKDCKQGCDACMPLHDGDNYCDIDMLCKILAVLKEHEAVVRCKDCRHCTFSDGEQLADCMIKQGWFPVKPDWFCADGENK